MEKAIATDSRGQEPGMFKENMAEVATPCHGRYLGNNTTINLWGRGYITKNLLI